MGLTPDQIQQGIVRLNRCMQRVYVWDPRVGDIETIKLDANALSAAVDAALTQTFGDGTLEFRRYSEATTFHYPLEGLIDADKNLIRNWLGPIESTPRLAGRASHSPLARRDKTPASRNDPTIAPAHD
jgi:hypothetical protein